MPSNSAVLIAQYACSASAFSWRRKRTRRRQVREASAQACLKNSETIPSSSCSRATRRMAESSMLEPLREDQEQDDEDDGAQAPAGIVAPMDAVGPHGEG